MDVLGIPPSTWVVLLTALIMLWSLCISIICVG